MCTQGGQTAAGYGSKGAMTGTAAGSSGSSSGKEGLLSLRYRVIAGLTLYKVQQNIYLLDFQKKEGDQFTFMSLCALIITQLKVLSAASKAMQIGLPGQSPQVHAV